MTISRRLLLLLTLAWVFPASAALAAASEDKAAMKWTGSWIWTGEEASPKNFYLYARKSFELTSAPKRARARICADSRYILWVNGVYVCRGPVRSDPREQYFDQMDISGFLRQGENVVAVLVHHYGEGTFSYIQGRGGLLFDCRVRCGGKRELDISSGPSWRLQPSEAWQRGFGRMSVQNGFCEVVTCAKEPCGWKEAGFNDSGWQPGSVVAPVGEGPWKTLVRREIPFLMEERVYPSAILETGRCEAAPLREDDPFNIARVMHEERLDPEGVRLVSHPDSLLGRPVADDIAAGRHWHGQVGKSQPSGLCLIRPPAREERSEGKGSYLVLDFGREVVGFPAVRIASSHGGTMDIGYCETLENGRVNPLRQGVKYADRVILTGGPESWQAFEKRAFRYMQIDFRGCAGPVALDEVSVIFTTYPVRWKGRVETPDERLNQIREMCAYTVQLNMEDAYTDCPWRERTQWWADARIEALAAYYAFGDTKLMRQGLKQIAQSQGDDGLTKCFYPGEFDNNIPGFCLIWVQSLWEYYQWSGDRKTLSALIDDVDRALKWFGARQREDGLIGDVGMWNFFDWAPLDLDGASTLVNSFAVGAFDAASKMAQALGRGEVAKAYSAQAGRIAAAVNSKLWHEGRGLYSDCLKDDGTLSSSFSEQSNASAVLFGIAPPERSGEVLDRLMEDDSGLTRCASPYFSFYLLQALWQEGRDREALDYTRANWGKMLDAGATTAWEQWTPTTSLCHGWSAAPAHDLGAHVLGVTPSEPGFGIVKIRPRPGSLPWANGVVPTPAGPVSVEWQADAEGFRLSYEAPERMKAEVVLPAGGDGPYVEVDGGRVEFEIDEGTIRLTIHRGGRHQIRVIYPR